MKSGPREPFAQRRGEDDRGVLVRPLLRVADLRARDLEDERAGVQLLRRADRPRAPCRRPSRAR